MTMRESQIEKYLKIKAVALGFEIRKVAWVGRKSAPDRVLFVKARPLTKTSIDCAWCNPKGRTIWIELKAPGKAPRPDQLREHARMRAAGQDVRVIDSIEGVDALMRELA